ncbi:MAG: Nucleotidyl transferase [uncultured bacterium]|nr:MAG: Nucleotidyl transferase [uncultured bacterium]
MSFQLQSTKETLFPALILAGGLATRLRPATEKIPKSLIEINGKAFVHHQLKLLFRQGIRKVIFCIGYLGEMIQQYVGDGSAYGLEVTYSFDGEVLLGTGGAIRHALPYLDDHFFVVYGDSYLDVNYANIQQAYLDSQKEGLMTVFKNQGQWDTSNVEFSNGKMIAYDKRNLTTRMHHIDFGLGIFSKKVFLQLPENTAIDLATIYQNLLINDQLAGFEVHNRFYEAGSFAGIKELGYYLSQSEYQE